MVITVAVRVTIEDALEVRVEDKSAALSEETPEVTAEEVPLSLESEAAPEPSSEYVTTDELALPDEASVTVAVAVNVVVL